MGHGAGQEGEDLLGVFSSSTSSTNNSPLDASALCVYPLDELDRHIDSTRDLCYTQDGRVEGREVVYIEYEVKSSCANLPLVRRVEVFLIHSSFDPLAKLRAAVFSALCASFSVETLGLHTIMNYSSVFLHLKYIDSICFSALRETQWRGQTSK